MILTTSSLYLVILINLPITTNDIFQTKTAAEAIVSQKQIDTLYIPVPTDTMRFSVVSKEFVPKQNWLQRNEGALLGSFLAAIVAVFSVWLTNFFNNRLGTKKAEIVKLQRKDTYCNILSTVYSELISHGNLTRTLKQELNEILRVFEEAGEIVASPITNIPIDFLNACRIKLIEYQIYNVGLLSYISHYVNAISILQPELNILKLRGFKSYFDNQDKYAQGVRNYFNELNSRLEKIEETWQRLNKLLEKEIGKFSQGTINIVDEFDKKMDC